MNPSRIAIMFATMVLLTGILGGSSFAMAEETISENYYKDVGEWVEGEGWVNGTSEENETETTALEDMVSSLFSTIFGVFEDIINFFVMVITAPFRAWAEVWGGWGSSFGSWYGPLLATIIVIAVIMVVQFWRYINNKLLNKGK